ncbi:ribonucleotide-transport ATP-binding protein ABC transporter Mkl [Patulibacter medicamentivorans]|uniref:Ribonucleotide-transport ATP-binding protein ABC transporter Mkl n=2 Tax=Patulibacter medicamentivorans TaxID=1097667 RepID=H0E5K8_9ACTN|nr:ribonucleotide-transport ATP-binding protein ABC transporter Mkl [Patulibacter medicamentivorans]
MTLDPDRSPLARLRERLERAVRHPSSAVSRLSYARTSVAFGLVGEPSTVTALLDRNPPEIVADASAEVRIDLTREQLARFEVGELAMPQAVVTGAVAAHGPVRKYLEVDAILRGLLAACDGREPQDGHRSDPAAAGSIPFAEADADLMAIRTTGLRKAFGRNEILAGVDLAIPEGVISVILGPSGTGKSVMLQHIIGLMSPDAGDVLIRGRPLSRMSRSEVLALRREIGVMFQDGALFSAMNVYDNVAFPLRQHTDLNDREVREVVMDHLDAVGLATATHRMPNELSGGMRKRAGLARALALNPGILLCDEPDSGLDPVRTALLGDLLVEQHSQYGGTMVVVTHNVALAKRIADHMSVLWRGRVLEAGMASDVLASDSAFIQQFLAGGSVGPLGMDA